MIYLASPYSHIDPTVREQRYQEAFNAVGHFIFTANLPVFSPIVYCHKLAIEHSAGTDAATWERFNFAMLSRAQALYILCLPGYEYSIGVQKEINFAKDLRIPRAYYSKSRDLIAVTGRDEDEKI